jgi:hypothetical protein
MRCLAHSHCLFCSVPARGLNNLTSASSILRLCEAVKVQFSDPYKYVGRIKLLYNFKNVSVLSFLKIVLLNLLKPTGLRDAPTV